MSSGVVLFARKPRTSRSCRASEIAVVKRGGITEKKDDEDEQDREKDQIAMSSQRCHSLLQTSGLSRKNAQPRLTKLNVIAHAASLQAR